MNKPPTHAALAGLAGPRALLVAILRPRLTKARAVLAAVFTVALTVALVAGVAAPASALSDSCWFGVYGGGRVDVYYTALNVDGPTADVRILVVNRSNVIVDPAINRFWDGLSRLSRGSGERIAPGNSTTWTIRGRWWQHSQHHFGGTNFFTDRCDVW